VLNRSSKEGKSGYWGFPKGHQNEGESNEDCAVRETCEETGIQCTLVNPKRAFVENGYSFIGPLHNDRWKLHKNYPDESKRPHFVIHKVVRYYLAAAPARKGEAQEDEIEALKWVPIQDLKTTLTHLNDFEAAMQLINHRDADIL